MLASTAPSGKTAPTRLKGILSLTVLSASNLPKHDLFGQNDAYTVLALNAGPTPPASPPKTPDDQTVMLQQTQVQFGSHPIWNEKLSFGVENDIETMDVQVWDADYDSHDLIGSVRISFSPAASQVSTETTGMTTATAGKTPGTLQLTLPAPLSKAWHTITTVPLTSAKKDKPAGTITLILHYLPESASEYLAKKFNHHQLVVKQKLVEKVVTRMTDMAASQVKGFVAA
ncbi:C2 domain-containing protein [Phlyctochytrium arcticum]|nr:C2 domain-containing protein [Phlyctochytrium arcticum]